MKIICLPSLGVTICLQLVNLKPSAHSQAQRGAREMPAAHVAWRCLHVLVAAVLVLVVVVVIAVISSEVPKFQ